MADGRVEAVAPAKVNLSLRVRSPDGTGLHPIHSLVQSISWTDRLTIEENEEDALEIIGAELDPGADNLVWRGVEGVRELAGGGPRVAVRLVKRLPVAAGIGGGSSDAAAAMIAYAEMIDFGGDLEEAAAGIGADVPFFLQGGLAWMDGYGEQLTPAGTVPTDYHVVLAVPPFELSTPAVYRAWDRLGEPGGPVIDPRAVPPSLRDLEPLANDLYPAARHCNADVDDWRSELASRWDRPVLMSGSGPTLFSFFTDEGEAEEGLQLVPSEARDAAVASPRDRGAALHTG